MSALPRTTDGRASPNEAGPLVLIALAAGGGGLSENRVVGCLQPCLRLLWALRRGMFR